MIKNFVNLKLQIILNKEMNLFFLQNVFANTFLINLFKKSYWTATFSKDLTNSLTLVKWIQIVMIY